MKRQAFSAPLNRNTIRKEFDKLYSARVLAVKELEEQIEKTIEPLSSHPRVMGRLKSFESYFKKCIKTLKNGSSGSSLLITDLIGIRIICPFLEDLSSVEELLKKHFTIIEIERKGGDHTFREFGYESIHLLINIPKDIVEKTGIPPSDTAEIQIRTILQEAWAEVEHELVYKAAFSPFDNPLKRKLAAVNASLSLADIIFQEIRSYQRALNGELGKRRDSFFEKIENVTDAVLFSHHSHAAGRDYPKDQAALPHPLPAASASTESSSSIDDLLLNALSAHNKNQLAEAIAVYTQILDMKPNEAVRAIIFKHRGMAYFARSNYEEAIADFSEALKLDPKSYKVAYYEGIVFSVLRRYSEAIDAYNFSLSINPFQPYCLYRRGQAFYHLEDYPQALGDCEAALAMENFEAAIKFRDLVQSKLKM